MSVIDAEKFKAIADSFQDSGGFDGMPSIVPFENPAEDSDLRDDPFELGADPFEDHVEKELDEDEMNERLDQLLLEVLAYLEANDLVDLVTASRDDRGVVLVLQEQVLFDTARAELKNDAIPFLNMVGELLEKVPNKVEVEGHTDSRPISTFQYPSNWELSGARASSVIRYLIDDYNLAADRFVSIGYGDTRPIVPNTSEENYQQNRRVVIIISDPANENKTY